MEVNNEDFKTVRLRRVLLSELAVLAEKTKHSVPDLIHMCIEDCLEATRSRLPIIPRMARLAAAVEKEVVVKDINTVLFLGKGTSPTPTPLREDPDAPPLPPPDQAP